MKFSNLIGALYIEARGDCSRRTETGESREEQGYGAENSERKKAGKMDPFFRSFSLVRAFPHYLDA